MCHKSQNKCQLTTLTRLLLQMLRYCYIQATFWALRLVRSCRYVAAKMKGEVIVGRFNNFQQETEPTQNQV
jgi:hypothetical protein